MNQNEDGWPARWTAQIGMAVRAAREARGVSAAGLSDKTADLGYRIPRNTIANLENGRKATIPLHELFLLARALRTSISFLAAYPDTDGHVESLPGRREEAGLLLSGLAGGTPYGVHGIGRLGEGFERLQQQHVFDLNLNNLWNTLGRIRDVRMRVQDADPGESDRLQGLLEVLLRERELVEDDLASAWRRYPYIRETVAVPEGFRRWLDSQMEGDDEQHQEAP